MSKRPRYIGREKVGKVPPTPANVLPPDPDALQREVPNFDACSFDGYGSIEDDNHTSNEIFANSSPPRLTCRGGFGSSIQVYRMIAEYAPTAAEKINKTGWGPFFKIDHKYVASHKVVESLVERWWYTTHTFHFRFGEMGITTTDWLFITGITIGQGSPLKYDSEMYTEEYVNDHIFPELKGVANSWKCGGIIVSSLKCYFNEGYLKHSETSPALVDRVVRAFCMFFLGTMLFSNAKCYIDAGWLASLDELDNIGDYDWGGAGYAYLVSTLNNLVKVGGTKQLNGAWQVLEIWFYEYFCTVRPGPITISPLVSAGAARWNDKLKKSSFPRIDLHDLIAVRSFIGGLAQDCIFNYPWSLEVFQDMPFQLAITQKAVSRLILSCGRTHIWYMGDRLAHQETQRWIISCTPPERLTKISDEEVSLWVTRGPVYHTELCVKISKAKYKEYWRHVTKTGKGWVDWSVTLCDKDKRKICFNIEEPNQHAEIPPVNKLSYGELYGLCQEQADFIGQFRAFALRHSENMADMIVTADENERRKNDTPKLLLGEVKREEEKT